MKDLLNGMIAVHDNVIQSPKISADKNTTRASKLREDIDEEDEPEMEHPVVVRRPYDPRSDARARQQHPRRRRGLVIQPAVALRALLDWAPLFYMETPLLR